jgi:hypothetical protein
MWRSKRRAFFVADLGSASVGRTVDSKASDDKLPEMQASKLRK